MSTSSGFRPRRTSIGAPRDANGNVQATSPYAYNTAGPGRNIDPGMSEAPSPAHDWTGFNQAFGGQAPESSIAPKPIQFQRPAADPRTGASWMPEPQQDQAGFNKLQPGQGRVIADNPDAPRTLYDPGTANTGKAMALNVPAQYGGGVGRSNYGNTTATAGRVIDNGKDVTADYGAGGKFSSGTPATEATAQAQPITTHFDTTRLKAEYPNIFQGGHADNQAFVKAYKDQYDPSKPMDEAGAFKLANSLGLKGTSATAQQNQGAGQNVAAEDTGGVGGVPQAPVSPGAAAAKAVKGAVTRAANTASGAVRDWTSNVADFANGIAPGSGAAAAGYAKALVNPFQAVRDAYQFATGGNSNTAQAPAAPTPGQPPQPQSNAPTGIKPTTPPIVGTAPQ